MEPIFLRVRSTVWSGQVTTYPLSSLRHLQRSANHRVHASLGNHTFELVECRDEDECLIVEDSILFHITQAVLTPQAHSPKPYVLDLSRIAAETLQDLRDEEDEAREMTRLDAILEARERDRETGYDGVRPDHTELECRGGED